MAMKAAAIKLRAAAAAAAAPSSGLRALLFSTSSLPAAKPPPAEPSTNLFVSGLNKRTTNEGLRAAFEKFGNVVDARVASDRVSGYSRGFGFVRYASLEDAQAGIKGMDGQFLDGWVIFAEYARPRNPSLAPQNGPANGFNAHF